MSHQIFIEVAKMYGVTAEDVRREIQAAIDEAYKNPNWHARRVYYKGDKPTPEEFIEHMARGLNNIQRQLSDIQAL